MRGREWFETAADGFVEVLTGLDPTGLDAPALGEWDVRALLGHTCRAFLTIETYLQAEPTSDTELRAPQDYFRAALAGLGEPARVAQRGRDAGAALGQDAVAAARAIAERVRALVGRTPDEAVAHLALGEMRLAAYLPTRAFELTVHGIDLARAAGRPVPEPLMAAVAPALELCLALASPAQRLQALLALTGREPLPGDFCVL